MLETEEILEATYKDSWYENTYMSLTFIIHFDYFTK